MKNLIVILLILINIDLSIGQITFEKSYNFFQGENAGQSIINDSNGNYIIATGGKFDSPQLNRTFGLAKLNSYGDTIWYKTFTRGYHPILKEVRKANDGYYVLGQCDDSSQFNTYMFWLSKFDTIGNHLWSYNYADPNIFIPDFGLDFHIINNGNLLVSSGYNRFYLINNLGNLLAIKPYYNFWNDTYEFLKPKFNFKNDVSYYTANYSQSFPSAPFHQRILKIDQDGDSIGSFQANLDSAWGASYLVKFINSNYLIFGFVPPVVAANDFRYVFTYVDSLGNKIWRKKLNGTNYINTCFSSHAVLQNGNIVFSGFPRTATYSPPKAKTFLYCFNDNGDSLWYKEYRVDTLHKTEFYDVIATADGGILACGQILMPDSSRQSYIVKLDANGNLFNPLSILEKKGEVYLHLYPNPATERTSIHFVGTNKNAILNITNLQGQIVYSKKLQSNDEHLTFDTSSLEVGYYFVNVTADNRLLTVKKLVIIK